MEEEPLKEAPDFTLSKLGRQDLYTLSIADLEERIQSLKTEITRCERAIEQRGSTRSAAEKLFKI